jgi:hypothetical protein
VSQEDSGPSRLQENFSWRRNECSSIDSCMDTDFFLLADVSRILRVQPYKIVYLLTTGQVPEPRLRIGNKRVFTMNDIYRLAEKLQVDLAQELVAKGEA